MPASAPSSAPRAIRLAGLVLAAAIVAAWANSFAGPFVFDDLGVIFDNPSLHHFATAFFPPRSGMTVTGRPLLNATFALNYALSGTDVWSYHALNLLIHLTAGLLLFGLVRRTLRRTRFHAEALPLALATTLLWSLHPLTTAAVTYVVQRAESLCALALLLTLYAFARATDCHSLDDKLKSSAPGGPDFCHLMDDKPVGPGRRGWLVLSVAACLAGMACKEVMAGAPLIVLLYDRTFVAGGFKNALRARRGFYFALAGTWLLLLSLQLATGTRGGTAGFNTGLDWRTYALTQCVAIFRYLRLALWPDALAFDYGTDPITTPWAIVPCAAGLALALGATVSALRRAPVLGFLAASFFIILAPSSSVVPIASQLQAEHRFYLPLAVVAILAALALRRIAGRRTLFLAALVATMLGTRTLARNTDYRSALALWESCARARPASVRAFFNLGIALADARRFPEAEAAFDRALALLSNSVAAGQARAAAADRAGKFAVYVRETEATARLTRATAAIHARLAQAFGQTDQFAPALAHFAEAVRLEPAADLRPQIAAVHLAAARAHERAGRHAEALASCEAAARLQPDDAAIASLLARLRPAPP
jgi:protein O-mannosyl-transferase